MPPLIRLMPRVITPVLAIAFCTVGLMNNARATSCPAEDLAGFVNALKDLTEVRHAHIQQPLTLQRVVIQGDQVSVRSSKAKEPVYEVDRVFALQKSNELNLIVELPDRLTIKDNSGESLIILLFEQTDCWKLTRIEDWSLGQLLPTADAIDAAAVAIKRGDLYNRLAGEAPSNSLIALYASALDSYLLGARMGSAKAAYLAAGISLSGQAPQLPPKRMQDLLETAARIIPEAGITLAYFYCGERDSDSDQSCANPEKALQALKDIARLDHKIALVELGNAYTSGDLTAPDAPRALACYLEAQSKGATGLADAINDLKAKGASAQEAVHCY